MKRRILVVDDSWTVRMDLRGALDAAGFLVTTCATKAAAHHELQSKVFAAVILDVILPDGSGIDLLREIKLSDELCNTPVLMLSTEAEVADRIRGMSHGADEYVGKPYDRAHVVHRVCELQDPDGAPRSSRQRPSKIAQRLFLVGRDAPFMDAVAERMRGDKHEVVLVRSCREALEPGAVAPIDCVIFDVSTLGDEAFEACRRLKQRGGTPGVAVVAIVLHDDARVRQAARASGADDLVVKSANLGPLRILLFNLLRKRRRAFDDAGAAEERPRAREAGTLFGEVVAASGLLPVIASSTIERACLRAGVNPRTMSSADLLRALPWLRDALGVFLSTEEATRRASQIAAIAHRAAGLGK